MRVAVAGFGVEGQSAARQWADLGHEIQVHDHLEIAVPPAYGGRTGNRYLTGLQDADLLVTGPGVRPDALPR